MRSIQVTFSSTEIGHTRAASADLTAQMTATARPTVCDILGVTADAGVVIVDSGATATVGSHAAQQLVPSSTQRFLLDTKVKIDVEAGRSMSFKLVWMQTPHGWFST